MTDEEAVKILSDMLGDMPFKGRDFAKVGGLYAWLAQLPERLRDSNSEDTDGGAV